MKIFLDDIRQPHHKQQSPNWVLCKTSSDFENVINQLLAVQKEWIEEASFDFMLNEDKDGNDCFKFLCETCVKFGLPIPKIYVHSEYPGATEYFQRTAKKFEEKLDVLIPITRIY